MAEATVKSKTKFTLWVGNINYQATENELREKFQVHVPVESVKIIQDHHTNISRGFGFVNLFSELDLNTVLDLKNGSMRLRNRALVVRKAHDNHIRPGHPFYTRPVLCDRDFDLQPLDPNKPCIHRLVDDTLLNIFERLDIVNLVKLERVCRRWQSIIYSILQGCTHVGYTNVNNKWRDFNLVYRHPQRWNRSRYIEKMVVLTGYALTHLNLTHFQGDQFTIAAIGQLAPQLECLRIETDASMKVKFGLASIVSGCKKLTTVAISGSMIADEIVRDLCSSTTLQTLQLRNVHISGSKLCDLPTTITTLSLWNISNLKANVFDSVCRFTNLRHLRLCSEQDCRYGIHVSFSPTNVGLLPTMLYNEERLHILAASCPQLHTLHVALSHGHAPDFTPFTNLKELCIIAENPLLHFLVTRLPAITHLKLLLRPGVSNLDDIDFSRCPSLQSIVLPRNIDIDDSSIASLLRLPRLTSVFFKDSSCSKRLISQLVACPTLEELGLHAVSLIDEELNELIEVRKKAIKTHKHKLSRTKSTSAASTASAADDTTAASTGDRISEEVPLLRLYIDTLLETDDNNVYIKVINTYGSSKYYRHGIDEAGDSDDDPAALDMPSDDDDDEYEGIFDDDASSYYNSDFDGDDIDFLDEEDDKYLFGYGNPGFQGGYYLGNWD